jgi:7-cyano-7-deazaguanine synthase
MTKALVVLSGGQDSTTCLALALKQFDSVAAVTFDYGQRHRREIDAARNVAKLMGVTEHEIVTLGPILKGTSPLTDPGAHLEQYQDHDSMADIIGDRVEKTFVPMRNALFLNIAANRAVVAGATVIVTGVCEADNANYPDCRASFLDAQEDAINYALGNDAHSNGRDGNGHWLRLYAPLISMSKEESIHALASIGGLHYLAFTHTAYDGQYPPLGKDHATVLRAEGFLRSGYPDPLVLRANIEGLMELPDTVNYQDQDLNRDLLIRIGNAKEALAGMVQA